MLFAEDDPSDVEFILRSLKKHDLASRVHAIADGAEALDFIFCSGAYSGRDIKSLPKVILLDLKLPKVNGIEVLRRIKADERTRSIPVVIMSSSHQKNEMSECYRLGANSYVVKPIDFEDFSEMIKRIGFYWLVTNQMPRG
ncbi:MAG: response regulator [Candidatus Omnitrophota bacterium]